MKRSLKFEKKTPKSVQKLRVTENKRAEYTKKLMKEKIPIRNARRQRTNTTACSGQWERARLGGICDVEI